MKIGELPISEQITANDFNEPFLMELIDRCYKDKLYKVAPIQRLRYFLLRFTSAVTFFALSIAALYGNFPWYWCVAAVMVQALIGTSLFGFIAHENTHRNYPKDLASRIMLRATWPIFWPFISQTPLRFEHNSQHIKIGDPEFDYEVAAFASIMRYSGHVD